MVARRHVPDGSSLLEDVNSGELIGNDSTLSDDRPWDTWYSQYGKPIRLPADAAQTKLLKMQGFSQTKPRRPRTQPTQMKLRNGSIFDLSSTAAEVSEAERYRMDKKPNGQPSNGPTATYYSKNGDVLPNLPADPESMKQYLELGLSLTPPANVAVPT